MLRPQNHHRAKGPDGQEVGGPEFSQFKETFETLGGLENLKEWTLNRFKGRRPGLPFRGIMLLGVPGTGKSHFAKALGNQVGWPCLSLNLGKVFGSLVGESEAKMRDALKVVDAMAPCVLFLDEIEKGLAGVGGGSTDGGTTQRVGGTFLTWLNDHTSEVFVIATCNDYSKLPPGIHPDGPVGRYLLCGESGVFSSVTTSWRFTWGSLWVRKTSTSPKCRTWTVTAVRKSGRWPSRPLTTAGIFRRQPGSSSPFPGPRKTRWTVSGMGPGPDHPGQPAGPGRGQGQEEGAVMMVLEISEETRQIIEVPVPISLPKWVWLIITARAKALHGGDIDTCVQELLNVGIQSEIKIMGTVGPGGRN